MASAERLLVSTCFGMYYYHHLLVSHQTETNMYTTVQNKNGFPCFTVIVKKKQLTMPYGRRNHKQYSLQVGISKNMITCVKLFYITVLSAVLII
jgi:hypothetical protein